MFDGAPAEPVVDCIGVPAEQCRSAVADAMASAAAGDRVTAITIRCTAPSCSPEDGEMAVTVILVGGRRTTSMSAWAMAPATAADEGTVVPLPVQPICAGVPVKACAQFATDSVQHLDRPADDVVSILVRCAADKPCVDERGAGSTDLTFRDGTHQTSEWIYEGAIGP